MATEVNFLKNRLVCSLTAALSNAYRVPAKYFEEDIIMLESKNVGRNYFILSIRTLYLLLVDYILKETDLVLVNILLGILEDRNRSKDFVYSFGRLLKADVKLGIRDERLVVKSRLIISKYLKTKNWDPFPVLGFS